MSDCKLTKRAALLQERITKDTAELADVHAQLNAAALMGNVGAGWTVSFKVGRDTTRREVVGTVQGRGLVKDVDSVRVISGEGFDAELFTVKVSDLLTVTAPDEGNTSADAAVTAAEPAVVATSDDLLSEVLG